VRATDLLLLLSSTLAGTAFAMGAGRILPAWDALARRRLRSLEVMIEALGLPESRIRLGLRAGVLLPMFVVVIPLLLLAYQSPKWVLSAVITSRKRLIRDQMVPFGFALANTARSGLSLTKGLEEVHRDSPWPIRDEIGRIVHDFHRGRTILDAIRDAQQRLKLDTFNIFAGVILTCFESGAKYTDALDNLSHSLQENQRLERKLASETAAGRTVITVLGGFPFAFLGMFYFLEPESTSRVFTTIPGQCMLVAVGFLTYLSVKLAQRIINIDI
jgi:Flp pilus assembly protein TadB